jgi:DNA-binding MarR family transcriptional regulator
MHPQTVFAKTAKGVLEIKNKTIKLPREVGLVFLSVDGKSTVADLAQKSGLPTPKLDEALDKLVADGYIKIFAAPSAGVAVPAPAHTPSITPGCILNTQ